MREHKITFCNLAATLYDDNGLLKNLAGRPTHQTASFEVGECTSAVYFEELNVGIFTRTLRHISSILGTGRAAGCFARKKFW